MELTEIINKIISNSYSTSNIDEEYQETFSNEGDRKATYIIDDLNLKESDNEIIVSKLCYFSIGGADGSEAEKILKDTEINKAILIEISDAAAEKARERAIDLLKVGKELIVLQGDAFDRLDDALTIIENFLSTKVISGLVVSAQAVLHELPRRSKGYSLPLFLGKLYRDPRLDYCLFYSREPCEPFGWTDRVKIKIAGVQNNDLYRLACHVRDRLNIKGSPEILATNWLDVESTLAIEFLHKLLRKSTLKRIEYELGEQLTEFNPFEVKKNLESCVEGMNVSLEYLITKGFKKALIENKVQYQGHNSEPLAMPQTHVEIIGFKSTKLNSTNFILHTEEIISVKKDLQSLPVNFKNPFENKITTKEILDWINQFQNHEKPILLKLLGGFQYFTYKRIEESCKIIFEKIQLLFGIDNPNLLYAQFGNPAKSSGIISYYFRTTNKIPESKFISIETLTTNSSEKKIIVFIDDLLASGHQALSILSNLSNTLNNKLCLAVLVACEQGLDLLYEKSNVEIISALEIKRSENPFDENNSLFIDDSEKNIAKEIVIKYGKASKYINPYGYAGTSLLLGFEYNTPDNTFPLFWADSDALKPLLKASGPGRQSQPDTMKE